MDELVSYMVNSLVSRPDDVKINTTEGDSSVLIELSVHPDDQAILLDNEGSLLGSIQQVLAIAGGDRKSVLDLVDRDGGAKEESAADEGDQSEG
jgi:predicted RNA-binding protein YlqC (UPF0109 family)